MFWRRKKHESMEVADLLARARTADPSTPAAAPTTPTGDFSMPVEDVFFITGRGTVVTGQVSSGTISVGQSVTVVRGGQSVATIEVLGVEQFRSVLETASAGDNVGLLLQGIQPHEVTAGDIIAA